MGEISIDILTLVLLPFAFKLIDLFSTWLSEKFKFKTKKMEVGDITIKSCQEKHANDVSGLRDEFNGRLDSIVKKMDQMAKTQQKTQLQITSLRAGVEKHNSVIDRTYKLEERMTDTEKTLAGAVSTLQFLTK